jgi:hypothetical protein
MDNFTNLLPIERRRALSHDFVLRVSVVAVVLSTFLVIIAGALLIPTYVYLEATIQAKKTYLAQVVSTLTSSDQTALAQRLRVLASNSDNLIALSHTPSVSATLQKVLGVAHPDITLSDFSYTPSESASTLATLVITGSSATRDALRSYQLALQGEPYARSVTLPVSAYASDKDINFSVTVTLSP